MCIVRIPLAPSSYEILRSHRFWPSTCSSGPFFLVSADDMAISISTRSIVCFLAKFEYRIVVNEIARVANDEILNIYCDANINDNEYEI